MPFTRLPVGFRTGLCIASLCGIPFWVSQTACRKEGDTPAMSLPYPFRKRQAAKARPEKLTTHFLNGYGFFYSLLSHLAGDQDPLPTKAIALFKN